MINNGLNLQASMRELRTSTTASADEHIAAAEKAYTDILQKARATAGLTNTPTCVPCDYCETPAGSPCVTAKGRATQPHSKRDYSYKQAVVNVHRAPLVVVTKAKLDELRAVQNAAKYVTGKATHAVQIYRVASLTVTNDPTYERLGHLGYRTLHACNILGVFSNTRFSTDELAYMISVGVKVHIVGKDIRDIIKRLVAPPNSVSALEKLALAIASIEETK